MSNIAEIILAIFVIAIAVSMAALVIGSLKSFKSDILKKSVKDRILSKDISMEEVADLIETQQFWEIVGEYAKLKPNDPLPDPPLNGDGWVDVYYDCDDPTECPCSEMNEDHCSGVVIDGKLKCKVRINLTQLCCGEKPQEKKPDPMLVTPEEAKILGDMVERFQKEKRV